MNIKLEWNDLTALLTVLNVGLIVGGVWWAPVVGLINCGLSIGLNIKERTHLNLFIIQIALIVLNIFFLKG